MYTCKHYLYLTGALVAEPGAPNCTHLVIDEHTVKQMPFKTMAKTHIVKSAVSVYMCVHPFVCVIMAYFGVW